MSVILEIKRGEIHGLVRAPMDDMCRHRQHPKQIMYEVFGHKAHLWKQHERLIFLIFGVTHCDHHTTNV